MSSGKSRGTVLWHSDFAKGRFVGFLSGGGTITITSNGKGHYVSRVQIANTELDILDQEYSALKQMGLKVVYRKNMKISTQIGTKPLHQMYVKGSDQVLPLLNSIKGDLIGRKRKLADLVIEFCERTNSRKHVGPSDRHYSNRDFEIVYEVRRLNGHVK